MKDALKAIIEDAQELLGLLEGAPANIEDDLMEVHRDLSAMLSAAQDNWPR